MTQDLKIRMGGLASLAGAVAGGWFFLMRPLQQARAGAPEITMDIKGAYVLVPLLLVWGVAFLVGGQRTRYRDVSVHPPKPTPLGWALTLVSLAAAGAVFWWMEAQLSALGYRM